MRVWPLLLSTLLVGASAVGQSPPEAESVAETYLQRSQAYQRETQDRPSEQIGKELFSELTSATKYLSDLSDPRAAKSAAYLQILETRRDEGDPEAAFYFGIFEWTICKQLTTSMVKAQKTCDSSIRSFRIAVEKGKDPRAMKALGMASKEGVGVQKSMLVAGDWFLKSARQFDAEGNREAALRSLEDALDAVPEYQAAKDLREKLLGQ